MTVSWAEGHFWNSETQDNQWLLSNYLPNSIKELAFGKKCYHSHSPVSSENKALGSYAQWSQPMMALLICRPWICAEVAGSSSSWR
jgi:hypothetical protein